ncbi:MAG: hypothetical protein JWN60_3272, partial [Acidobacteria bacterium]|nr:hypothetical protein [Acidobacteriota bacterium]
LPPDANRLERHAEVNLLSDGTIQGKVRQQSFGQSASFERGRLSELSASDYSSNIERWLTNRIKGGKVTKTVPSDRRLEGKFDLDIEFLAPNYAQIMQGRLMVFNPAMIGRLDQFSVVENKRITPITIDSSSYSETIRVKLPEGFVIDEMPETSKIETAYGKYNAKYEVSGGFLLLTRTLVLNRTTLPAANYEDVKNFFGVVRSAEVSPVVLLKK